jgi:hypothetical protein
MVQFINDYLFYVLPDYARVRENFTSALTFSILWRSALTPLYLKLEDDWGLGYNLGYAKEDTPYATIQRAPSFFKILDDYIYLNKSPLGKGINGDVILVINKNDKKKYALKVINNFV